MKRMNRRALVGVNLGLVGILGVLCVLPSAGAGNVPGQPDRARGNYTMVSGKIQGNNTHALYIVDAANQELVAMRWDIGRNDLVMMGYRNLVADAKAIKGIR